MCLEYPPHFRARLAVYLSLLCNFVTAPTSHECWPHALLFEDHRQLNRTLTNPAARTAASIVF